MNGFLKFAWLVVPISIWINLSKLYLCLHDQSNFRKLFPEHCYSNVNKPKRYGSCYFLYLTTLLASGSQIELPPLEEAVTFVEGFRLNPEPDGGIPGILPVPGALPELLYFRIRLRLREISLFFRLQFLRSFRIFFPAASANFVKPGARAAPC